MSDSVPAPMVQLPADTVEKLRQQTLGWTGVKKFPLLTAARAVVDAATPAASVPAADILALAEKWEGQADRFEAAGLTVEGLPVRGTVATLRALVAAAEQADKGDGADTMHDCNSGGEDGYCSNCDPALAFTFPAREQADKGEGGQRGGKSQDTATPHDPSLTAPAAPVGEPLPEGWHHIPWTSKEDGVGAPETPASGEPGPPAPPALCVGCGHEVGLHNEKGCLHGWAGPEGLCRCRLDGSQVARVPVNDEAEAGECDNGQANTCRHLSASGLDRTFGPGKVWRCDHCGLCWIEGYSPHDPRAARGEDA